MMQDLWVTVSKTGNSKRVVESRSSQANALSATRPKCWYFVDLRFRLSSQLSFCRINDAEKPPEHNKIMRE